VLFDLSDVLCHMDHQARLEALAELCGSDAAHIYDQIWASGLDTEFDRGDHGDAAGVLETLRARVGLRGDLATLERAWMAAFLPDEDLLSVIDDIRPDIGCAVLSDNGPVLLGALPRYLPELWQRFDHVVFSCEIGVLKPSAEAFRAAAATLGCPPSAITFFDDLPANIEAARTFGMRAEVFRDARQVRESLARAELLRPSEGTAQPGRTTGKRRRPGRYEGRAG
jgi:putative hydrolase of the HAD superfamily